MSIKVSIIVTAYNEKDYISRCINSLLKQTYKESEIIIIDNGSSDNTFEIAKKLGVKVFRIEKNLGPGGGRNFGAKKAKGEILVFVDADMTFDKNFVKILVKPILSGKEIGTSHRFEYVSNKENIWARAWSINRIPNNIPKRIGIFRAIKKKKFLDMGGFDPKKGYFDDDIGDFGGALIVDAICYHNNPENLSEAFKHSLWVGKSFHQNKSAFKGYLRNYSIHLIFSLFFLITLIYFFVKLSLNLFFLPLMLLSGYLVILEYISIKRFIKEGYISHIYSIPILMTVKFTGYLIGFLKSLIISK